LHANVVLLFFGFFITSQIFSNQCDHCKLLMTLHPTWLQHLTVSVADGMTVTTISQTLLSD